MSDAPAVPPVDTERTTILYQRRGPVLAFVWGALALCFIKGWLFRWSHPDAFYMGLAVVVSLFGSVVLWFPPRLTMTPEQFSGSSFGVLWFTVPWRDVAAMTEFRSQWGRSLGLKVKPGLAAEKGVRKFSTAGTAYDILVSSRWEIPLDGVAQRAAAYWKANGGSGVISDTITAPDFARLVTDTPER